jgi:hypothetical protein
MINYLPFSHPINTLMQITEIITGPLRDEFIDHKSVYFSSALTVAKIRHLELKKANVGNDLCYGLIDPTVAVSNSLVGILQLVPRAAMYQVELVQIAQAYKGQGFGTFLYDYAIMNDRLTILSDSNHSEDHLGGSKGLWEKLYRQGRFKVMGFDLDTDTVLPNVNPQTVYNQKDNIVWLATPFERQETINEMLLRLNTRNKAKTIVWYGPSTVSGDNF